MGNIRDQPLQEPYAAPFIKTPVSDYFLRVINYQNRTDCGMYELHYSDCMEAYGHHIGRKKCRLIYEDLYECIYRIKRFRRTALMREERKRQYKSGERDKQYPDTFPPLDLF
ncbi:uncharacterized protein LOC105275454 [Ooceraea biroi]|uniref:Uncharacterized protein n=1 Tax=Ooceraea biroi TaxID=2015173 RepID=A0A026WVC0_OOCBI|nr:uncharacterized protein LOC105275454 [Ooceraea biroi]EZA59054.1 hypothetical protein X777_15695 [Ooceraea biroi]